MNTSCKMLTLIFGSVGGNRSVCCGETTLRGRSHCEKHRSEELTRLSQMRERAKRHMEAVDADYHAYLSEGYDP